MTIDSLLLQSMMKKADLANIAPVETGSVDGRYSNILSN